MIGQVSVFLVILFKTSRGLKGNSRVDSEMPFVEVLPETIRVHKEVV